MGKRCCFLPHSSWICSYNLTNHLLIPTWVTVGYWCPWPCLLWSVAHSTHTPDSSLHTHPFLHLYMPHTPTRLLIPHIHPYTHSYHSPKGPHSLIPHNPFIPHMCTPTPHSHAYTPPFHTHTHPSTHPHTTHSVYPPRRKRMHPFQLSQKLPHYIYSSKEEETNLGE